MPIDDNPARTLASCQFYLEIQGGFTMSRVGDFVVGAICGGGLTLGAMNFHVVRADDGFHLFRKVSTGTAQTYVDVRGYSAADWGENRPLATAIVRSGKGEILADTTLAGVRNSVQDWMRSGEGPR
jgi:hypothetical protein